jgi:hypothetical protein
MTDGKKQNCRNNCGAQIFVSDRTGRWLPYNWGTDNKHDCPNFQQKRTSDFERNKQMYAGPSVEDGIIKDIQNNSVRLDAHELRIKELERTLSGLDSAIAKLSFKKASEVEETEEVQEE